MDFAAFDRGWLKALFAVVAMRRVDIVDHQVKRRDGARRWRLVGLSDNDMRAAAQFEHRQPVHRPNRPKSGHLQPAGGRRDIRARLPYMANRYRRPAIDLRHAASSFSGQFYTM